MPLDPQAKALLDAIEQSGAPPLNSYEPAEARAVYDQASEQVRGNPPDPAAVEEIFIPGPDGEMKAWLYRPSDEAALPVLVFFHGGGYTIGSLQSHDCVCRALCVEAQCIVISVDYRLAPEHKYPAAADDAWAATQWVASNAESLGGDPSRIAVGGDSAGGNLAAVVSLQAKEAGGPQLAFQLLIYPGTDMDCSFESHETFGAGYRLTKELIAWFYEHYFSPEDDLKHWRASPLNADDFSGLPPAFILSAGYDPLQDEDAAYAVNLIEAGVAVAHTHYAGMMHGFITMPGAIDKAKQALSECAEVLSKALLTEL
jgi:acetyl esterase